MKTVCRVIEPHGDGFLVMSINCAKPEIAWRLAANRLRRAERAAMLKARKGKLTEYQWKIVNNLRAGLAADAHISKGRYDREHGGFTASLRALVRRGLVTDDKQLTEDGRNYSE